MGSLATSQAAALSVYTGHSHTSRGGNPEASGIVCPEKWALSTQEVLTPYASLPMSRLSPCACVEIIRGTEGKGGKMVTLKITNIHRKLMCHGALHTVYLPHPYKEGTTVLLILGMRRPRLRKLRNSPLSL